MFKELKEIISEQLKGSMKIMRKSQRENLNKEIEMIKKNHTKILELESIMTKMKNSLEVFNSRFQQVEKESVILKIGKLGLPVLRKRKKNEEN